MFEYEAAITEVHDGDTVHAMVDLGLDIRHMITLRLYGINAPELNTERGRQAKQWLIDRLANHETIIVRTLKDRREKYGRYLATLHDPADMANINHELVTAGLAAPYFGGKRDD